MKYLHEYPTLNEVVGSIIAFMAIAAIVYLAIGGSDAAQTALVSVAGAAAGTYYSNTRQQQTDPKRPSGPVPPTPPAPAA